MSIALRARLSPALWRRGQRLFWALADQGIFALTNFVLNVLFARWLPTRDYGLYAVSFSGFLFLSILHWGAVVEPLIVQASQIELAQRRAFTVALIRAHLLLLLLCGGVTALAIVIAHLRHNPDIGLEVAGAGIGGTLVLTLYTMRRLCLVFFTAQLSASVGLAYCSGVILTAWAVKSMGAVNWFEIWVIMGMWSSACSSLIFVLLLHRSRGTAPYSLRDLLRFQFTYARWGVGAAFCSWLRSEGLLLMVAQVTGLAAVAQLRVISSLCNPLFQVNSALNVFWLIGFAETPRSARARRLWHTAIPYAVAGIGLVLLAFGFYHPLVVVLFGPRYTAAAWMLPLFYAALILNGIETVICSALKSWGEVRRAYLPQYGGTVVAVSLAFAMIPRHGAAGAAYCFVISGLAGVLISMWTGWRHVRQPVAEQAV